MPGEMKKRDQPQIANPLISVVVLEVCYESLSYVNSHVKREINEIYFQFVEIFILGI